MTHDAIGDGEWPVIPLFLAGGGAPIPSYPRSTPAPAPSPLVRRTRAAKGSGLPKSERRKAARIRKRTEKSCEFCKRMWHPVSKRFRFCSRPCAAESNGLARVNRHRILTREMAATIREAYAAGERVCDIARAHGVPYWTARDAALGNTWRGTRGAAE